MMYKDPFDFKSVLFDGGLKACALFLLLFLGLHDTVILYSLVEVFTILITYVTFILVWTSRDYVTNRYVLFIGVSYFFVGTFDLLHILSHEFPILPLFEVNADAKTHQLWIISRFFQSTSFLLGVICLYKKIKTELLFFIYLIVSVAFVCCINTGWLLFPVLSVNAVSIYTEKLFLTDTIEVLSLLTALYFLIILRNKFEPRLYKYLMLFTSFITVSEMSYMFISMDEKVSSFIASMFRLVSYYFLYEAVVKTAIIDPYSFFVKRLSAGKKELKLIEDMYENLFESINLGVVVLRVVNKGADFVVISINKYALQLDSLKKREVIDRKVTSIWPGALDYGILAVFKRVYLTGKSEEFPTSLYTDGDVKFWRNNYIYKLGSGYLVSVYSDETEKKRILDALQESEKRYRTVANFTYDWEYWVGPNREYIYTSPSCERVTGYSSEDFMKDPKFLKTMVHKDDYDAVCQHFSDERLEGKLKRLDFRITTKDGEEKWLGHACLPVYDKDGTFLGRRASNRDITARKLLELELFKSKSLLESLFDAMLTPVFYKDVNLQYIGVNRAFTDFFGFTSKEIKGKSVYDVHPKEWADIYSAMDDELLKTGESQTYDTKMAGITGNVEDVSLNKTVFKDVNGNVVGIIGVVIVITERKRLEEDLIKSEKRFRALAENQYDVFWAIDEDFKFDYISPSCERVTGHTVEDVMCTTDPSIFYTPESWKVMMEAFWTLVGNLSNESKGVVLEVQQYRVNGDIFPGEITAIPIVIDGEFRGIQGITRDITERVEGRKALEKSKLKFETLLNNLNVAVYRTTPEPDSKFLECNPAAIKIFRANSKKDLLSTKVRNLWRTPEDRIQLKVMDSIVNKELNLKRLDGSDLIGSMSAVAVRDKEGKIKYYDCVLEDITDRRDLEVQLQHAIKMEAMGRLAGGIAHDFNNTLSVLIGYSDLLLKDMEETGKYYKEISAINTNALRAKDLVAQLLTFSRKTTLEATSINVHSLLTEFKSFIDRVLREDIKLEFNILNDRLFVDADISQLEHVLINIAVNAQDAMEGGGKLIVNTELVDSIKSYGSSNIGSGKYLLISISDNGHGMSKDVQDKVFEPFYTTKARGYGTGLGLSTAYSIVKQHGGDIWLYSEENIGTTFKIYLPVTTKRLLRKPTTVNTLEEVGGSETIVLVEDDVDVLSLIQGILNTFGYRVYAYNNPTECIKQMNDSNVSIDLLLTDVVMNDMSGKDLCAILLNKFPDMKYIYMSGYTKSIVNERGVSDKDAPFIQKPFTNRELGVLIRSVLDSPINKERSTCDG